MRMYIANDQSWRFSYSTTIYDTFSKKVFVEYRHNIDIHEEFQTTAEAILETVIANTTPLMLKGYLIEDAYPEKASISVEREIPLDLLKEFVVARYLHRELEDVVDLIVEYDEIRASFLRLAVLLATRRKDDETLTNQQAITVLRQIADQLEVLERGY